MVPFDVSCREVQELLPPYLSGVLPGDERDRLERHLGVCLTCARAVRAHRDLQRVIRRVFGEGERAPETLKLGILRCMDCMDDPGGTACPRLSARLVGRRRSR